MKKWLTIFCVIVISVLLIDFVWHFPLAKGKTVARVRSIPDGFIEIQEAIDMSDRIAEWVIWETQISFLDEEGSTCIYQTTADKKFIVRYNDHYYINGEEWMQVLQRLG